MLGIIMVEFFFSFSVEEIKHFEENVEVVLPKSVVNNLPEQIENLPENNNSQ